MKTKLENGLEAMVTMLALNVRETDGRFTDGELLAIEALETVCKQCFKVSEARDDLDKNVLNNLLNLLVFIDLYKSNAISGLAFIISIESLLI